MPKPSDVRPVAAELHLLPIETRVPLKFGPETLTQVTCARAKVTVESADGRTADGWGETPLNVQWVWPSPLSYLERLDALTSFCRGVAELWSKLGIAGHPMEVGHRVLERELPERLRGFNAGRDEAMPWLAALVCDSPFDIALHDAFGRLHGRPTYELYGPAWCGADLASFLEPAGVFAGKYVADYLAEAPPAALTAWHLVGGLDALTDEDLDGHEPDDGYPVTLAGWVAADGLRCLKVKLRGTDSEWDFARLVRVGDVALGAGVRWLSADFNCTVTDPAYVTATLDRLLAERPDVYAALLYVEQPFPYDLEAHRIDARPVSARKPLFLDESAHDWRLIRLGRDLGWSGVALKTCKTQTGALLSLCWAKEHGMPVMVQDLTNPMLAQIPHVLLAAHAGTIQGVETNAMQFYPEASRPESAVHPGLYTRRQGVVDLSTLAGPGFGYRLDEIDRDLDAD